MSWQWNHNPDNSAWSLTKRKGHLRLTNARLDSVFVQARNLLTQRTFGPVCTAAASVDVSGLKDGDMAGLGLLQERYGFVAVRKTGKKLELVMVNASNGKPEVSAVLPLGQSKIYLRTTCDFTNKKDEATFFYSLDHIAWSEIGTTLKMSYKLSHFMGYRFALFNYATRKTGGFADFDFFRVSDNKSKKL